MINFNKLLNAHLSNNHTDMKTIFINQNFDKGHFTIYPYFFLSEKEDEVTEYSDWVGSFEGGTPSVSTYCENGEKTIIYHQYGDNNGTFPFLYLRNFHSMKSSYIDIIDEFILYFNLYKNNNNYLLIDDGGNEHIAITINGTTEVKVKTILLMEFMEIKNYFLALNFDIAEYNFSNKFELNFQNTDYDYFDSKNEFGHLQTSVGKKIIRKPEKRKKKIEEYESYIIGVDECGDNIEFSCNKDNLSNYFGANEGNPHYLTPIFFKKDVLTKYYSQIEKYSVDDGGLHCGGLWMLKLDMNNPDYITSYLGDLGSTLPFPEQKYWKSFNTPPNGTISDVEFKRSFMAEFTNSTDEVPIFKGSLHNINKEWTRRHGFNLFKPLNESDLHHYKSFRIPLTNEQKDFDEQLHSLSKMLLDSINIKRNQ